MVLVKDYKRQIKDYKDQQLSPSVVLPVGRRLEIFIRRDGLHPSKVIQHPHLKRDREESETGPGQNRFWWFWWFSTWVMLNLAKNQLWSVGQSIISGCRLNRAFFAKSASVPFTWNTVGSEVMWAPGCTWVYLGNRWVLLPGRRIQTGWCERRADSEDRSPAACSNRSGPETWTGTPGGSPGGQRSRFINNSYETFNK